MSKNGRYEPGDAVERHDDAEDYDEALLLEDLESLREEMEEAGVETLAQAQTWLTQPAANRTALQAVIEHMIDLDVTDRAELDQRIRQMQESMGWDE